MVNIRSVHWLSVNGRLWIHHHFPVICVIWKHIEEKRQPSHPYQHQIQTQFQHIKQQMVSSIRIVKAISRMHHRFQVKI